ncbi:MAG: tRNA lysidine(34) synthetase TilS [Clostridia bacterium]|nr:tRNA lysidine(34) synthetase TilS [Clostridia bacterium]
MKATNARALPVEFLSPALLSGLSPDTPILVAYSGGADSTALLHMLSRYAKETGATLYAAHVNHGIRGKEADRDEAFCRDTAQALGIELFVHRADVPALAKEWGESIETAARRVRYAFFDRLMAQYHIPLLATAHNADDNLETMLFNLARGTGLGGMCGIPVTRRCPEGTLIRPILSMTRASILSYCHEQGLSYVTDSTNVDTDYTRNKLRASVTPVLTGINPGAVANSARLAEQLREDSLCLESMADLFLEGFREEDGIELEKLNGSPAAVVNRALRRLYGELVPDGSLEYGHVLALRRLAEKGIPNTSVTLPGGVEAVIRQGKLTLRKRLPIIDYPPYTLPLAEGSNRISQTNCEIVMLPSQNTKNIYKNSILLSLDSDKIIGNLFVRGRLPGDRIRMGGMRKSLKKLMCDKKIPPELRGRLPVVCDSQGILAVPGIGLRDGVKPTSDTARPVDLHVYLY